MGTKVVPVRLSNEILQTIDTLVKLGVFSSRSEALRELIRTGLRNYEKLTEIAKGVEKLFILEKEMGEIPIKLEGATEELLKEREER